MRCTTFVFLKFLYTSIVQYVVYDILAQSTDDAQTMTGEDFVF